MRFQTILRSTAATALAAACGLASAATFTVTNANDAGSGSLRAAIGQANGAAGADTIAFNIPGAGVHLITLSSALPPISTTMTIDGATQPGYAGAPLIDVRGVNVAADGFVVSGANVQIKALAIHGFGGRGVLVSGANFTLTGCYVGLFANGGAEGNTTGVWLENTGGHVIGPGNVISGNSVDGLRLNGAGATGITIKGNRIGTDASGAGGAGNAFNGIVLTGAASNLIGGTTAADLNVVSGNTKNGIALASGASGNLIERNFVGVAADGTTAMGNGLAGVIIIDSPNNTVGGSVAGTYNVLSANGAEGVQIKNAASSGNLVQRNLIGTDLFGAQCHGNGGNVGFLSGVMIDGAPGNTIGGGAWGAGGNLISCDYGGGVRITGAGATNNLVQGNRIGTDVNGTVALSNSTGPGVRIDGGASQNQVGAAGAGNLLSGNSYPGLDIDGASQNKVYANLVGTDPTGLAAVPNQFAGIELEGGATSNDIGGADPSLRNIVAGNLGGGIHLRGDAATSSNRIQGNWIGLGADGRALGNTDSGIVVDTGATSNTIGGTAAGQGNVISSNGAHGIDLEGDSNAVYANRIGTTTDGNAGRPNALNGIDVSYANGAQIGTSNAGNQISGNLGHGIRLGYQFRGNRSIFGNLIGTDAAGTGALGNGGDGIRVDGESSNAIGSSGAARNVISGNAGAGIRIDGPDVQNNLVRGNRIGVRADVNQGLPNGQHGVAIVQGLGHQTIGGVGSGDGNVIAGNGGDGVFIAASADNRVLRNAIFGNGGLAIDLAPDGVNGNDAGDGDDGANRLQNAPVLSSAVLDGLVQIAGTLNSTPGTTFRIEYFASSSCDPSGFGESETYLGTNNATTDGSGNAAIAAGWSGALGQAITVTATGASGAGDTSEFSNCAIVAAPLSTLSFAAATASIAEGGGSVTLTVNRTGYTGNAVSVNFASANGSAAAGADYTAVGGALAFAAGQTSATIAVPILDDAIDEGAETFTVALSGPSANAQVGAPATVTVTIADDDPTPTLSVDNGGCSVPETNGSTSCTFTFRLSNPSASAVTFTTQTADGTATSGSDYVGHGPTARSIAAGQTTLDVVVPITGDTQLEPDETFTLAATGVTHATPASLSATGTILNDDTTPTLSVDNGGCSVSEGNSGSVNCNFVFRLSSATTSAVTFTTATSAGTATSGVDFTGHASTARSIPAGQTTLTVSVPVLGDALDEPNETFALSAGGVANATPGSLVATGTIVDDDAAPNLTVDNCSVVEGNSGTASCTFHVRLSAPSGNTVTVNWASMPSDVPALLDSFEAPAVGGVTSLGVGQVFGPWTVDAGSIDLIPTSFWQASDASQSIDLSGGSAGTIHTDVPVIPGQAYRLHFALAANVGCGSAVKRVQVSWAGTSLGTFSFDGTGHSNGNMGWQHLEVAAPAVAASSARLTFASLDASACGPALDEVAVVRSGYAFWPVDFAAQTGSVSIAPGQIVSATQTVTVNGDAQVEPDEDFAIVLYGGANYGTRGAGAVAIVNDDQLADAIFKNGFE